MHMARTIWSQWKTDTLCFCMHMPIFEQKKTLGMTMTEKSIHHKYNSDIIDFNSLFKYKSRKNLWTSQILQHFAAIVLVRLQVCTKACMTAVFPWVNAIYRLSNQLTFRLYSYYAIQIYVVITDCISGEMFTPLLISFGATKFFLNQIKHTAMD